MRTLLLLTLLFLPLTAFAGSVDGLVKKASPYNVTRTLDRLEHVLEKKDITVALRWRHGQRAQDVDIDLQPTEVMIFGNPRIGSHLMTGAQTAGIDLPLKALAWRDADGQVWLGYNRPQYIAERHGIEDRQATVNKMADALDKLTAAAIAED